MAPIHPARSAVGRAPHGDRRLAASPHLVYGRLVRQREEFVELEGGQLWTTTSGRGVPMILCHGEPGGHDYLAPVAEMVEDLAEVHRFDQRGGGCSLAAGPWTVAALLSDMEVLRQH